MAIVNLRKVSYLSDHVYYLKKLNSQNYEIVDWYQNLQTIVSENKKITEFEDN